ncbi:hypothetical protein IQ251_15310 [Saccharopolyspora sp. HNM0983]|uniref:Uncharacterized protein n=1 Tax=Saccharopolyspora montiporae TaxID=2781240 RepID=A0A929G2I0_9PSEU|nr:hypothetical protein [Saccharopolyspora sp. HNM0983]MBE9375818.1 hypothetical protein [Saccharopolyspora sp. HNM0983]
MSLPELSRGLVGEIDRALARGGVSELPADELQRLVGAVVRLYAAANEGAEREVPPVDERVATTDAVVLASALLKAQDLNPFDLALWFSRGRAAG